MKGFRFKRKRNSARQSLRQRFVLSFTKQGRKINRMHGFYEKLKKCLSGDLLELVSIETRNERAKVIKDKIQKQIELQFEKTFNIPRYEQLFSKAKEGKLRMKPASALELIQKAEATAKELVDVLLILDREVNEMPRATPNYIIEYAKLRELNHAYENAMLLPKLHLLLLAEKLRKKYSF